MEDKYFKHKESDKSKKIVKNYNMENLYEHAHSELSLQQNKRDQIITLYLAIITFLIPFIISLESINLTFKGLMFIGVALLE